VQPVIRFDSIARSVKIQPIGWESNFTNYDNIFSLEITSHVATNLTIRNYEFFKKFFSIQIFAQILHTDDLYCFKIMISQFYVLEEKAAQFSGCPIQMNTMVNEY
jgi:hypothetical protein